MEVERAFFYDTSSDDCTRKVISCRKESLDQESNYVFGVDKRSSYVILFNSRRWIDLIAQILLFMILISFDIIEI